MLVHSSVFLARRSRNSDSSVSNRIGWPGDDIAEGTDSALVPERDSPFQDKGVWNSRFWLNFDGAVVSAQESFIVANAGVSESEIPAFKPSGINADTHCIFS